MQNVRELVCQMTGANVRIIKIQSTVVVSLTFPSGFHQRRVPLVVDLLYVGPALQQQHRQLHVAAARRQRQRRLEAVRRHVHLTQPNIY